MLRKWKEGWVCLLGTLTILTVDDLLKEITIRSQKHTVIQAVNRQLTHYGYNIGQIVYLTKLRSGKKWKTLSITKGKLEEYNEDMRKKNI